MRAGREYFTGCFVRLVMWDSRVELSRFQSSKHVVPMLGIDNCLADGDVGLQSKIQRDRQQYRAFTLHFVRRSYPT